MKHLIDIFSRSCIFILWYDHSYGIVSEIIYIPGIIFLFFHVNKWYIFSAYSTYSFTVHFSLDLNNYKWTSSNTQRRNPNVSFFFLQTTFLSVVRTPIHTHIHTTHTVFSHFHSYLLFLLLFSTFSLHFCFFFFSRSRVRF